MIDKKTAFAAIDEVLAEMPRTGVPDGVSLADNRVDRSGFDGLIDLPVYEHDTIVPTWGYAPIPSASAFTLISREGGRVTGQLTAGFEFLHGSVCVYLETIIVATDKRGHGVGLGLQDAFMEVFKDALDKDPDLALRLDPDVGGDFNEIGSAFASMMSRRITDLLEEIEETPSPTA